MPSGAEHRERAYVAASRRTDRPAEARLASAIKASQAHFERTGRRFKITMEVVLGDEMYREEEEPRTRHTSSYTTALSYDRKRSPDDCEESFEVRERRVNQMFDLAFPWHRQDCLQQNERREREKQEDREEHERDTREREEAGLLGQRTATAPGGLNGVGATHMSTFDVTSGPRMTHIIAARQARESRAASMASGVSGTSGASGASGTTFSDPKPSTPGLSPTPHTPGTNAAPAHGTGYDTLSPSSVSTDTIALNSGGMASGQNYTTVFVGPDASVYSPGFAIGTQKSDTTQPPLAESLLVDTAAAKAMYSPWTPGDDELVSVENYNFSGQSVLPQTSADPDGPLSDQVVAKDENGNYYLVLEGNGDYSTSSSSYLDNNDSCSNMIMRSFNPSMLSSMGVPDLDAGLFSSADPAETVLGEPTTMLYGYASSTASPIAAPDDRDYMYATSMTAFPPFTADR